MRIIALAAVLTSLGCIDWRFSRPPPIADAGPDIDAAIDVDAMGDPAVLTTEQQPHDFTDVTIGQQSASLPVVIRNSGGEPAGAIALSLSGDVADFEIDPASDCMDAVLAPDQTCTASVKFRPGTAGPRAANLEVSAAPGGTATVALGGNGLSPGNLEFTAGDALSFSTIEIQSQSGFQVVTVRNNGGTATAPLTVSLGDSTNYYKQVGDTCQGVPLGAGLSCTVQVRFNPTVVGSLPAQLSVRESDTVGVSSSLSGTGSARLGVTKLGTGTGTIVSTQPGISCGTACTASEVAFSQSPVTLTASVVSGHAFEGWGGACASAGLEPVCVVGLSQALTSVTATFRAWVCTPDTIDCNDTTDHYVDCSPTGTIDQERDCPLECAAGVEKCLDVDPSNGLSAYLDQAATDPGAYAVILAGNSIMNTDTGAVVDGDGASELVPHASFGGMRVFMFRSLSISGTLNVSGSLPAVFVSDGAIVITGTIDVSADPVGGPGSQTAGACVGGSTTTNPGGGGGGGGKFSSGRSGGTGNGNAGGTSGAANADADLIPLTGGCSAGGARFNSSVRSNGGAGGGALQIVSRTSVSMTGSGAVDASGGGGTACNELIASQICGGGGGGSGGAILIEAPQVVLDGALVVLSTKGGAGAAAGNSSVSTAAGADGGTGPSAAAGGTNGSLASGGAGGTETLNPVTGTSSTTANGGGGGGSVGEVRVNTRSGSFNPVNGATIRSRSSVGTLSTRQVP